MLQVGDHVWTDRIVAQDWIRDVAVVTEVGELVVWLQFDDGVVVSRFIGSRVALTALERLALLGKTAL